MHNYVTIKHVAMDIWNIKICNYMNVELNNMQLTTKYRNYKIVEIRHYKIQKYKLQPCVTKKHRTVDL